eukprot:scaffold21972_cov22-Tisochrysis_lutea.AAC.2
MDTKARLRFVRDFQHMEAEGKLKEDRLSNKAHDLQHPAANTQLACACISHVPRGICTCLEWAQHLDNTLADGLNTWTTPWLMGSAPGQHPG